MNEIRAVNESWTMSGSFIDWIDWTDWIVGEWIEGLSVTQSWRVEESWTLTESWTVNEQRTLNER